MIVDRVKHTLVISFSLFSVLFLKVKSISLPAGNAWIINKARFRKFSMKKQMSNFSLVLTTVLRCFSLWKYCVGRHWYYLMLLPYEKSYISIFEKYCAILVLIMHLPGNNSVAIVIVRRDRYIFTAKWKKNPELLDWFLFLEEVFLLTWKYWSKIREIWMKSGPCKINKLCISLRHLGCQIFVQNCDSPVNKML